MKEIFRWILVLALITLGLIMVVMPFTSTWDFTTGQAMSPKLKLMFALIGGLLIFAAIRLLLRKRQS